MTFNEIWDEYMAHKIKRVKPSTVAAYSVLWKQLKNDFGNIEIESITTKKAEKWAIDMLSTVCRKTIEDRLTLLNNIIEYYAYEYEVAVSPIKRKYIRWPTINAEENEIDNVKTFSSQDISAILLRIAQDPLPQNILVALMIGTGIRIGEACALTYGNINTEKGTIEIKYTLERILTPETYNDADYERMNVRVIHKCRKSTLILMPPKCKASRRSVPIPNELLKVLKKFMSVYPVNYFIGSNKFIPMEPRRLRVHYYNLLDTAGVTQKLNPHALRHTYATTLITSGVDIRTTAALLGHNDASTTLDVYSHATAESKEKAMKITVGKQFKSALTKLS